MLQSCLWVVLFAVSVLHSTEASPVSGTTSFGCPLHGAFIGDARDCSRFYRCVWGKLFYFTCPTGTRWSQHLLTCDHARNVPCHSAPYVGHGVGTSYGGYSGKKPAVVASTYYPQHDYGTHSYYHYGHYNTYPVVGYYGTPNYGGYNTQTAAYDGNFRGGHQADHHGYNQHYNTAYPPYDYRRHPYVRPVYGFYPSFADSYDNVVFARKDPYLPYPNYGTFLAGLSRYYH